MTNTRREGPSDNRQGRSQFGGADRVQEAPARSHSRAKRFEMEAQDLRPVGTAMADPNECYSVKDACRVLNVHRDTLYELEKRGAIRLVRPQGLRRTLVKKSEVERFLRSAPVGRE